MCISLLYCVKKKKRVRVYIDRRGDHTWLGKKIISSSSSSSGLLLTFDDIVRIVQYTLVDPKNGALFFLYLSVRMGLLQECQAKLSTGGLCSSLSTEQKKKKKKKSQNSRVYIQLSLCDGRLRRDHNIARQPTQHPTAKLFPFSCSFLSFFFCVPDFFFFFLVLFCVWNPCELLANKDLQ